MFHGKCKMIQICSNPLLNIGFTFYDQNWKLLPNVWGKPGLQINKPKLLDKMIWISEKLSEEFDFVRIDLYLVDDNFYFGEMTHYPASGYRKITQKELDFQLGSYWNI